MCVEFSVSMKGIAEALGGAARYGENDKEVKEYISTYTSFGEMPGTTEVTTTDVQTKVYLVLMFGETVVVAVDIQLKELVQSFGI